LQIRHEFSIESKDLSDYLLFVERLQRPNSGSAPLKIPQNGHETAIVG
jgi:hypothetical protein